MSIVKNAELSVTDRNPDPRDSTHGHRRSGCCARQGDRLTPEQHAATFKLALFWRQGWRNEIAARNREDGAAEIQTVERPRQTNGLDRAKFAAGIARAEFGRFYRDERKNRGVSTIRSSPEHSEVAS
jgi:hypothetical protein